MGIHCFTTGKSSYTLGACPAVKNAETRDTKEVTLRVNARDAGANMGAYTVVL